MHRAFHAVVFCGLFIFVLNVQPMVEAMPDWLVGYVFIGIMCLSVGVLIGVHSAGGEILPRPPEPKIASEPEPERPSEQKAASVVDFRPRA